MPRQTLQRPRACCRRAARPPDRRQRSMLACTCKWLQAALVCGWGTETPCLRWALASPHTAPGGHETLGTRLPQTDRRKHGRLLAGLGLGGLGLGYRFRVGQGTEGRLAGRGCPRSRQRSSLGPAECVTRRRGWRRAKGRLGSPPGKQRGWGLGVRVRAPFRV